MDLVLPQTGERAPILTALMNRSKENHRLDDLKTTIEELITLLNEFGEQGWQIFTKAELPL